MQKVEKELEKGMHINPDFSLNRREKVSVHGKNGKVFEGKVKIPKEVKRLSNELDKKKYVESLSR